MTKKPTTAQEEKSEGIVAMAIFLGVVDLGLSKLISFILAA